MTKPTNITGIILCGGKSSRMEMDKSLLKLGDYNLVEHGILLLENFCENILISSNSLGDENFDHPVIPDKIEGIGPLAGIYSCLLNSDHEHNFIISCDTPFLSKATVSYILENSEDYDIVLPEFIGYIQPLTGYFNRRILPVLEKEIQRSHFKPIQLFKSLNLKVLKIDETLTFYKNYLFFNINKRADYDEACRIYNNISQ